jgi:hypothetical protein
LSTARSSFCAATSLDVRHVLAIDEEIDQLPDLDPEDFFSDPAVPGEEHGSRRQSVRPASRSRKRKIGAYNPFNEVFDALTAAPVALRTYDISIQQGLINIAPKCRVLLGYIKDVIDGLYIPDQVHSEVQAIDAEVELARQRFPAGSVKLICEFDFEVARHGEDGCFPRTIGEQESEEDLLELARAYAFVGSTLRYPHLDALTGKPKPVAEAKRLWTEFESAGRALQVLAGWIRGLSTSRSAPTCSICYRHIASRVRCAEHTTKTHETREGRLGKRVRPNYLERLKKLEAMPHGQNLQRVGVKAGIATRDLEEYFRGKGTENDEWIGRFEQLAEFLGGFRDLSAAQAEDMLDLFGDLLTQAGSFAALPRPRTSDERKKYAALQDALRQLVSPIGFLKAWFTGRTPLVAGMPAASRRGYDTRHPIARGRPVGVLTLTRQLLMQRAWDEAIGEYLARAMPTADQVRVLRGEGLSYAKIGERFKLSHEGVRIALARRADARARNRLV